MNVRLLKILDATLGLFLCWAGGRLLYLLHRETAFSEFRPEDIKRVLVIRPGGLGDMVLLQPMLKKLHAQYPHALIDLVCERRNEDVLKFSSFSVNVFTYDARPFQLIRRLCAGGYDVVIDSEQFHYFSAVMAVLCRAPIRIGYKINPGRNPLYTHLISYDMEGYEADEFMKLLGPFGIEGRAEVAGCLVPPEVNLPDEIADFLGRVQQREQRLILIHVGASTRYKTWAAANFVELLRKLCGTDETIIGLVGGGGDYALATRVAEQSGRLAQVKVMAGRLGIAQTAKVLTKASLFVGGDSGLAHLAAVFSVPSVVMFGPSDAKKWCRESDVVRVVRKTMSCSPCFIFGYHKYCRTLACMNQMQVADVLAACSTVSPSQPRFHV